MSYREHETYSDRIYAPLRHSEDGRPPPRTSSFAPSGHHRQQGLGAHRLPPSSRASGPTNVREAFGMALWPDHLRRDDRPKTAVTPQRRRALILTYALDWTAAIVLWVVFALIDRITGVMREFSLTDTSIQHSFAEQERVPMWLCIVVAILAPALIIAFIAVVFRRSFWDLHNAMLGFVLAQSFNWVITDAVKLTVGRPRPDLIARCQPADGAANLPYYGLATAARVCTTLGTGKLSDGFRSFPSGHSSASFAGLGFLSFYLAGKLHLFDQRGHSLKSWVALTPLLGAALIAISRTSDNRHHATDVLAGSLVGFFVALWSYLLYYPPFTSPNCHLPYSPRIPAEDGGHEGNFATLAGDRTAASKDFLEVDNGTVRRPSQELARPSTEEYPLGGRPQQQTGQNYV